MPMIFDADTIKKQMYEANRGYNNRLTWASMYGSIDLASQQQKSETTMDFSKAINDAYVSSNMNNQGIYNSNLGEGYKKSLVEQNRAELDAAYDTYMSNMQKQIAEINSASSTYYENIKQQADETAQNFSDLAYSNLDYLQYLYETNPDAVMNNPNYSKYLKKEVVTDPETGEAMVDENGNTMYNYSMKTNDELLQAAYSIGSDGQKEYSSLFDENGNLTLAGVDFFDQMQNDTEFSKANGLDSYDEWLRKTNPELREFMRSTNPYEYNYYYDENGNLYGDATNLGSFRTMTGRMSDDYTYEFAERFGGMTSTQITEMFKPFKEIAELDFNEPTDVKNNFKTELIQQQVDSLDTLLNTLGLNETLSDAGINYDELMSSLKNQFENIDSLNKDLEDASNLWWMNSLDYAAKGALAGAAVGGAVTAATGGIAAPAMLVLGAITGFIGLVGGAIEGGIKGKNKADEIKQKKQEALLKIETGYKQLLNELVNAMLMERRNKEIEFNQKYGL